jgi:hypothetical protein
VYTRLSSRLIKWRHDDRNISLKQMIFVVELRCHWDDGRTFEQLANHFAVREPCVHITESAPLSRAEGASRQQNHKLLDSPKTTESSGK